VVFGKPITHPALEQRRQGGGDGTASPVDMDAVVEELHSQYQAALVALGDEHGMRVEVV
jgi:hypothetical protein